MSALRPVCRGLCMTVRAQNAKVRKLIVGVVTVNVIKVKSDWASEPCRAVYRAPGHLTSFFLEALFDESLS